MPIYEYACESCGHQLETMQKMSDDALTTCPECSAEALKRLISQTSFVLKGTGWYKTDYATKPAPKAGEAKSEGKSEAKSEGKSETKTASKPEAKAAVSASTGD